MMTKMTGLTENDPHSFANPDECIVTNVHLDIEIDFKRKVIEGFVDIAFEKKSPRATSLVLDTQNLDIKDVSSAKTKSKLEYDVSTVDPIFGTKLEIQLPKSEGINDTDRIRIEYATTPSSSALQWLTPEQTAGGKHPYLYSHCEPIHARAMLPCQDTPSVKMPFTATVRAPRELTVLMSAVREGGSESGDGGIKETKFKQKVPVPAYLIALVAGALESRKIGPRSTVWAEKEYVDLAVVDFEDTELMLSTAE